MPEVQTRNEFLQIDLGNIIPIFGLEVQGSTDLDAYVSSFSILYSEEGNTFSQVLDENNNLKVGYLNIRIHNPLDHTWRRSKELSICHKRKFSNPYIFAA